MPAKDSMGHGGKYQTDVRYFIVGNSVFGIFRYWEYQRRYTTVSAFKNIQYLFGFR